MLINISKQSADGPQKFCRKDQGLQGQKLREDPKRTSFRLEGPLKIGSRRLDGLVTDAGYENGDRYRPKVAVKEGGRGGTRKTK